jgi:cytochrome P450
MIDSLVDDGGGDLVSQVAGPLPVAVIAELLSVPPQRHAEFRVWSDDVIANTASVSPEQMTQSAIHLYLLFRRVVARASKAPRDDLVGSIVRLSRSGEDPLSQDEITLFFMVLLIAGTETTTNLICNMIACLDAADDQWAQLQGDPGLVSSAIEEVLRFDAPTQGLDREVRSPTSVADSELPVGGRVRLMFGSANRDEGWLPDADRFCVSRQVTDHLAFGHGIHYCVGASLARVEATLVLEELVRRGCRLRPAGEWRRLRHAVLRGFAAMPVEVTHERVR